MGYKGLAGAAGVAAMNHSWYSSSGFPTWLFWVLVVVMACAALFHLILWAEPRLQELAERRTQRRRDRYYKEVTESYARLRKKAGDDAPRRP